MKQTTLLLVVILFAISSFAQNISADVNNFEPSKVFLFTEKIETENVLKVVVDTSIKTFDEPTFAKLKNITFENGTIEVKVLSRLVKNAPDWARGFIGLAFRIEEHNSKFESIYIRPTNGRVEDQVRRNHSIQYFAFPDYKFERLRKESPEKYESYADMGLNEWITIRIEVEGQKAKLFLNDNKQPSLVVNDLKLGGNNSGSVGLWVGNWTEGYFKDLKVTRLKP